MLPSSRVSLYPCPSSPLISYICSVVDELNIMYTPSPKKIKMNSYPLLQQITSDIQQINHSITLLQQLYNIQSNTKQGDDNKQEGEDAVEEIIVEWVASKVGRVKNDLQEVVEKIVIASKENSQEVCILLLLLTNYYISLLLYSNYSLSFPTAC